jgi:protein gp37
MAKTLIEWATHTINPVVGCKKCSPGCDNCYAEKFAARLAGNPKTADIYGPVITNGKWNGEVNVNPLAFDSLPKKKPCRVFLGSMTDMLYPPAYEELRICIAEMSRHENCTFMLLTKRSDRMLDLTPWPNIWLGVTVCNQKEADEKIPLLLQMGAAKRFVSIEPMLGPIDLSHYLSELFFQCTSCGHREGNPELKCPECASYNENKNGPRDCPECGLTAGNNPISVCSKCGEDTEQPAATLDWVIVGGETGPGARPMEADWARAIRDQCKSADVPFFFKKMGGKKETPDDLMIREVPNGQ